MKKIPCCIAAFIAPALLLAGCETTPGREKEQAGSVVGAVVGGVIGSQFGGGSGRTAATIVGAVAGGVLGNAIGRNMDETDRMRAAQALETSQTGTPTSWRNPDTGREYTVVPTRTYQSAEGPCREYTMNTVIGGRPEKVYGTACRQSDGSWRATN
jgi:surface antigen